MNISMIKAGITSESVHYWGGTSFKPSIMLDFQFVTFDDECGLRQFFSIDDAINFLFLKGFKNSARELNKLKD